MPPVLPLSVSMGTRHALAFASCHLVHAQSATTSFTQVNVTGRKHAMHVSARQSLWIMVTRTTQLESVSITQLQARPVPQAMVKVPTLPLPLFSL